MNKSESVTCTADETSFARRVRYGEMSATDPKPVTRRWRLLVVDDEESILSALTRVLRREGYELSTANSAADALLLMEKHPANLVISDHRMPGMTGIEFLREVRHRWPESIRIILSGYSEVDTIISAINEGAIYKFLTKPWNDEELRLNLRRALEQLELEEENRRLIQGIEDQNRQLQELNNLLDQRAADSSMGLNLAQNVLDSAEVGVVTIDDMGLIVNMNRFASNLLRSCAAGLIGISAKSSLPRELYAAITDAPLSRPSHASGCLKLSGRSIQWRVSALSSPQRRLGHVLLLWEDIQ
jgi:DNA-binding response OmpR family regulator